MKNTLVNFASNVQYYLNIINNSESWEINFYPSIGHYDLPDLMDIGNQPRYVLEWYDEYAEHILDMPREVALLIFTEKKLPGGLATGMQRYLAYRALERKGENVMK